MSFGSKSWPSAHFEVIVVVAVVVVVVVVVVSAFVEVVGSDVFAEMIPSLSVVMQVKHMAHPQRRV